MSEANQDAKEILITQYQTGLDQLDRGKSQFFRD
jgi:hypothetical protein